MRECVKHVHALCESRDETAVILLVKEIPGFLSVLEIYAYLDSVFGNGYQRIERRAYPAFLLGNPFKSADMHIAALEDSVRLDDLAKGRDDFLAKAVNAEGEKLDGKEHLSGNVCEPVNDKTGNKIGLRKQKPVRIGGHVKTLPCIGGFADAARKKFCVDVLVLATGKDAHTNLRIAVHHPAAEKLAILGKYVKNLTGGAVALIPADLIVEHPRVSETDTFFFFCLQENPVHAGQYIDFVALSQLVCYCKRMKAMRCILPVLFCFLFVSASLASENQGELRSDLTDESRRELLSLAASEIPAEKLGEWKDILDSALFMIFRKTELYRGPLRVLVQDSKSVQVRFYPEGTFVISSGLLDYIDNALFESAADSPRRMRNFYSEREAMLVPFLVPEAAHFALDHQFSAFSRTQTDNGQMTGGNSLSKRLRPSGTEVLEADGFSIVLLSLAGFDPEVYTAWLGSLETVKDKTELADNFAEYLASVPSAGTRLSAIETSRKSITKTCGEFASVLASIHSGTGFSEAASSVDALRKTWPTSTYIDRLDAIVLQRYWLTTVPLTDRVLKTNYPTADESDSMREEFVNLASSKEPIQAMFPADRTTQPGDVKLYTAAYDAFTRTMQAYTDPVLSSSFAMLEVWSPSRNDRRSAIRIAAEAASLETGGESFVARANYATILYMTGTDTSRAQLMMEQLLSQGTSGENGVASAIGARGEKAKRSGSVSSGIPGDERDLSINLALMYRYSGNESRAEAVLEPARKLVVPAGEKGSIALRMMHIGDGTDELIARWGQPSEIVYNYYTENWNYASLCASVKIVPDSSSGRRISLIRLSPRSPVSPGADIRTGDKRVDFEAAFGKPAYRAADSYIYVYEGNRISVFYVADKIRSIIVGL